MEWKDRIVATPDTLFGKPRIKDTRISVELLMDRLADGWSMDDIVTAYAVGKAGHDQTAA